MKEIEVLDKLAQGEVSIFEAHNMIEHKKMVPAKAKKARFVKLHIDPHDESRGARLFLKALFALPLPLGIIRFFVVKTLYGKISENEAWDIDKETLINMLKYAKDTTISVESSDATIHIKIF
ncbi:MAG: hypothetical protein ACQEQA_02715 [Bacillota bacterium]